MCWYSPWPPLSPLAWDTASFARICNGVFFAASLLVPYYLLAGLIRWILQGLCALANRLTGPTSASAAASIVLVLAILLSAAVQAQPQPAAPEPPVTVPEDAIIVPYDVKSQTGIQDANRLLVPNERDVRAMEPRLSRQEDRRPSLRRFPTPSRVQPTVPCWKARKR